MAEYTPVDTCGFVTSERTNAKSTSLTVGFFDSFNNPAHRHINIEFAWSKMNN